MKWVKKENLIEKWIEAYRKKSMKFNESLREWAANAREVNALNHKLKPCGGAREETKWVMNEWSELLRRPRPAAVIQFLHPLHFFSH